MGLRNPRGGRGYWDARARAFPPGCGRRTSGARLAPGSLGMYSFGEGSGGGGRRGLGGAVCSAGGGWTREMPPTPGSPSFRKHEVQLLQRSCGVWALERRGASQRGPRPLPRLRGAPHPRELTARAEPSRCTALPGSARCLRGPVPAPALCCHWRVPAALAGRFAGLRLLHPDAARRPRRG